MAAEGPDPKTFASWEDAFKYPIPAVRGMERQLRQDIDSNREKLRTLVGASYRDLLGTAESIIHMDGQMHEVEIYMGEIGEKCNNRLMEKKSSNMRSWEYTIEASVEVEKARYAAASHLAVLQSCPNVITRILKSGGSVLLAAKVLVIARLLHTKLSQRQNPPPLLDSVKSRIGSLRRRLSGRVDRRFKSLDITHEVLIEAMCAFSLATSSSPRDVLQHFYYIRQEAISERINESAAGHESILQAMRVYVKTVKDAQVIMPGQFAHALEKLKSTSLFKSKDVYSLTGLNLDVHVRWISDDIKTFIPYVKHDELRQSEAEKLLKKWAQSEFTSFLHGLNNRIRDVQDPLHLMTLRKEVLELWLSTHHYSMGINSAEGLDGLRQVFVHQCSCIIQNQVSRLRSVGLTVQETLRTWHPGVSDLIPSLWDTSMLSLNLSDGSKTFIEDLKSRSAGKNQPVNKAIMEYSYFLQSIESIEEVIQKLRAMKWAEDDDIEEEDDILDSKQVLLNEDDPSSLQESLTSTLNEAFTDLQAALDKLGQELEGSNRGQQATYLLRIWRELRQNFPKSSNKPKFGLTSIPHLQNLLAEEALRMPVQRCLKRIAKSTDPARALWEGDPALPVLPSPWTYRLLLDLSSSMVDFGNDIWSPASTNVLKGRMRSQLAELIEKTRNASDIDGIANGVDSLEAPAGEELDVEKIRDDTTDTLLNGHYDNHISDKPRNADPQVLFDVFYLVHATTFVGEVSGMGVEGKDLLNVQEALAAKLEVSSVERMEKDAGDYWKRTALLFALLA